MLNKSFKIIHNKYYRFFRFIFFLRYLFAVFFVSFTLFLIIPNFFNHEKKMTIIKDQFLKSYNLKIENYEEINFKSFPTPRLELKNVSIYMNRSDIKINLKDLKILPNFLSIYNFDQFQIKKVVLKESKVELEASNLNFFIREILKKRNKLHVDNLDLEIMEKNKSIVKLENIVFANYGYKLNLIQGKIFKKKFKIETKDNLKGFKFKLVKSGISADINFNENQNSNLISGVLKSKILNTNLIFNFDYDNKSMNINNLFFRSKKISFKNENAISLKPFLDVKSSFNIEEIDPKILKRINFEKLFEQKDMIKKINFKNEIKFKSNKLSSDLIDELNLKIDLAYGRMTIMKLVFISGHLFQCKGDTNLLEDYPVITFNCNLKSENKKNFFKIFNVKPKIKNKTLEINIKGTLSILNKKVNFKEIKMNKNYVALKDDLNYFKRTFEDVLYDETFFDIFNPKKIREFILEVS